jgi:pyrroline-5-carboxylate reductase
MSYELGIIGAGNMAEAIVRGLSRGPTIAADRIIVCDVSPQRREFFQSQFKTAATNDNQTAARHSRLLLLSVKPQQMASVLNDLRTVLDPKTLIISIAAGISTSFIEKNLGDGAWRVVRAMPNTPMLLGQGMAVIARGSRATAADLAEARRIFESAAKVVEMTEDKLDAVTAVSGSGPAYFFYLTEQLIKAAIELGIAPAEALLLATQTALGAARMLTESDQEPAELRRKVTSPGGTTQAAVTHLDSAGWPAATIEAVKAAARRGRELSQ